MTTTLHYTSVTVTGGRLTDFRRQPSRVSTLTIIHGPLSSLRLKGYNTCRNVCVSKQSTWQTSTYQDLAEHTTLQALLNGEVTVVGAGAATE